MSKTTVKVELSTRGIQNAINEIKQYKRDLAQKCERLREAVAERLAEESQKGFSGAIVEDNIKHVVGKETTTAEKRLADVHVSVDNRGSVTLVIADGKDAVWVEFGAGVYHNGSVGSSPNPHGDELRFTIGGFGQNGSKKAWGYPDGDGYTITRGTPAKMPMTNAVTNVIDDLPEIVREVFG